MITDIIIVDRFIKQEEPSKLRRFFVEGFRKVSTGITIKLHGL